MLSIIVDHQQQSKKSQGAGSSREEEAAEGRGNAVLLQQRGAPKAEKNEVICRCTLPRHAFTCLDEQGCRNKTPRERRRGAGVRFLASGG